MKKFLALTFVALACALPLAARTIIFDIHGVLLHEDLANYVKTKVTAALQDMKKDTRSLRKCRPYKLLCELMEEHNILGDLDLPLDTYPEKCHYPLETFMMFAGHVHPDDVYERTKAMIAGAHFDNNVDRLLVDALVDAIFDREEFLDTVVELREGTVLFEALLAKEEHTVCVLSNAPHPWIELYHDQFPHIFNALPREQVLSSGKLGFLKPNKTAFEEAAKVCGTQLDDVLLIDDTQGNVDGAQAHGMQAIFFDYKNIDGIIAQLHGEGILDDTDVATIIGKLEGNRTTTHFGERTFY